MWERALDWVYPPKCALCGSMGRPAICDDCKAEFVACQPVLLGPLGPLDWRCSLYEFQGRAAQAVKRLKYSRVTSLANPMARLLAESRCDCPETDVVVPVPIHRTRRACRGFNQSELLCAGMPQEAVRASLAVRTRKTRPQVELTAAERMANLQGAFLATEGVKGLRVTLVDDVITTGGTALACAEVLRAAGAIEVGVLTFCGEKARPTPQTKIWPTDRPYAD